MYLVICLNARRRLFRLPAWVVVGLCIVAGCAAAVNLQHPEIEHQSDAVANHRMGLQGGAWVVADGAPASSPQFLQLVDVLYFLQKDPVTLGLPRSILDTPLATVETVSPFCHDIRSDLVLTGTPTGDLAAAAAAQHIATARPDWPWLTTLRTEKPQLRLFWPGIKSLAMQVLVLLSAALTLLGLARIATATRRELADLRGLCRSCHYPAHGLTGLCPECGAPIVTTPCVEANDVDSANTQQRLQPPTIV
jgi:hypothetical protein